MKKTVLGIMLTLLLIGMSPFMFNIQQVRAEETTVKILPEVVEYGPQCVVGQNFTVACVVENVADLAGIDIRLCWNTTFLAYQGHSLTVPVEDYLDPIPPSPYPGILHEPEIIITNVVDIPNGTYWGSAATFRGGASFNGSGTVFVMTFQIVSQPSFGEHDVNLSIHFTSTDLAASTTSGGGAIPHDVFDGTVIIHALKPEHDIAITDVTTSKTVVIHGRTMLINVTTENQGQYTETSNVTAYANATIIDTLTNITFINGTFTTVLLTWNTTGWSKGNYTITAYASQVPGETDTTDNTHIDGSVRVIGYPVANFTYSPITPIVNETIAFNATRSTPNGGAIINYTWDFGDGSNEEGILVCHNYSKTGTYNVTLIVVDTEGLNDTAWKTVNVLIHDVAVANVTPATNKIIEGQIVNITVVTQNKGNFTETLTITTYANTSTINQTQFTLQSLASTTFTFSWNTTGFTPGNYTIKAVADTVPSETNTDDNTYVDGIVAVRLPVHDIAVTDVVPAANVVVRGFNLSISVTVENLGDFAETFNVEVFANTTTVGEEEVFLDLAESVILVFTWNTTEFSVGQYTINATVAVVPGETETADNMYIDGVIAVVPQLHDIAIINITTSKTVTGQAYSLQFNVTVKNFGNTVETFNVTAYFNITTIQTRNITLESESLTILTFTWDTTDCDLGNYCISAYASPVSGETNIANNNLTDGWVTVTIIGDVDGDFDVDIYDIVKICTAYGYELGDPEYDANSDIDGDGDVDIYDIVIMCNHYGETYP